MKHHGNTKIEVEGKTLLEHAEELGLSYQTVYRRYRRTGQVTRSQKTHPKVIEYMGHTWTVKDLVKETGISSTTLYNRIKRHPDDPSKWLTSASSGRKASIFYVCPETGDERTIREWADTWNLTRQGAALRLETLGYQRVDK